MQKQITEKSFYRYLKCPSWIAHEAKAGHVEDALRSRIQADGMLPEQHRKLLTSRKNVVEVTEPDLDDAFVKTLELMKSGVDSIYGGALIHGHWVGRPDLLERVQGKSVFGDYYYVACDIKRSRHLKDEYRMQGCFYAELLKVIQKSKPRQGYVMHPDGSVEAYVIEEFETRFQLTLDGIERILEGIDEPHFLTSDCKQSPWFHECKRQSVECDDLSRLNRVWRSEAEALRSAGIQTVTDLSKANADLITAKVSGITRERLSFLIEQARALVAGKVITMGRIDLPEGKDALVIDVEADPLRDLHYLFGVLDVHGEQKTFHPFLADHPDKEREAWESFVSFMQGFPGVPIYHYGWYEIDVFRLMVERYGAPEGFLEDIEARSIDLLVRLRESVIFPLSFYSLKDIAQYLGFRWRHEDASGLNSVLWFEEWLRTGDREVLDDILRYNEDDVLATWHVAQWAMKHTL